MISIYAPTTRARRVFIALLAFALAVALAIVASNAPAEAKDPKVYTATPHEQVAVNSSVALTFTNETETETQLAGSFSILFPAGFVDLDATVQSPAGTTWNVLSQTGDNPVIVSAASGGDRIGIGPANAVTVTVSWSDAPSGTHQLTTDGDQQAGGVFSGGNEFRLVGPEPTLVIATPCASPCDIPDPNFTAVLTCGPECSFIKNLPGTNVADITVFEDGSIVLVLETDGKGPAPGEAFVEVFDDDGNSLGNLPPCGVNGPPQCVHINRIHGNHTQYTVFFADDPRFRFR